MINSVARALAILETLDQANEGLLALGDISRRCKLNPSTAHSILATLAQLGYAAHDAATRRYALGPRAGTLGRGRHLAGILAAVAKPVLKELGESLGETVLLTLYRACGRHTILTVESRQLLRVGAPPAIDDQLFQTATGRVLLSLLPEPELAAVLEELGAPASRWHEAQTAEALRAGLDAIRREGAAVVHRADAHIHAIAVPVALRAPDAFASLGTYYPAVRSLPGREAAFIAALREAAWRITALFEAGADAPAPLERPAQAALSANTAPPGETPS
jgi:DNA-binding IclR family transcriptional regulator